MMKHENVDTETDENVCQTNVSQFMVSVKPVS